MTRLKFFSLSHKFGVVSLRIPNRKQKKQNESLKQQSISQKIDQRKTPYKLVFFYGGLESVEVFNEEIEQLSLNILTTEFVDFLISCECAILMKESKMLLYAETGNIFSVTVILKRASIILYAHNKTTPKKTR